MADPFTDELRALRERAYGPGADIHDDAEALARLHALEERERAAATDAPADTGVDAVSRATAAPAEQPAESAAGQVPGATAVPAAEGSGIRAPSDAPLAQAVPEEIEPTAPAGPWWKRRMPRLWALSLVAAALLGAVATLGLQSLQSGRVAVLLEDRDGAWPEEGWGPQPADGRTFEEFFGLTVISQPQYVGNGTVSTCLYIFGGGPDMFAMAGNGCSAGSFPATAALLVSGQAPRELLERFPEDTALQFVLDGERVAVYADKP